MVLVAGSNGHTLFRMIDLDNNSNNNTQSILCIHRRASYSHQDSMVGNTNVAYNTADNVYW